MAAPFTDQQYNQALAVPADQKTTVQWDIITQVQNFRIQQLLNAQQNPGQAPPPAAVAPIQMTAAQLTQLTNALQPAAPQQAFVVPENPLYTRRNQIDAHGNPIPDVIVLYQDQPPNAGVKDKKKVVIPTPFTGHKDDARPFIQRCEGMFFDLPNEYRLTRDRIHFMCKLLQNSRTYPWAYQVMNAVMIPEHNTYYTDNWMDFKNVFLLRFGNVDEARDAIIKINCLQQDKGLILDYITEFNRLADIARVDRESLIYAFIKGLQPALYTRVATQPNGEPTTLQGWEDACEVQSVIQQRTQAMLNNQKHTHHYRPSQTFHPTANKQAPRPRLYDNDAMQVDAILHDQRQRRSQQQGARPQGQRPLPPRPQAGPSTRPNPLPRPLSGPLHPKRSQCFVARSQRLQQFLTALVPN